ncbi:hypothetical protein ACFSCX_12480 [Bacillus salitolerans]|uniref:Uncharacterized protein n=1 Tax=Bacillus salitolerans TaxID=1437434 RepID=A0ABW4LQN5_9BACI
MYVIFILRPIDPTRTVVSFQLVNEEMIIDFQLVKLEDGSWRAGWVPMQ